jgi:hypothetical protein
MSSAVEYNRLRAAHVDPASPGGALLPAQNAEIAKCNSQTHGEEVMLSTPAVAPINAGVAV